MKLALLAIIKKQPLVIRCQQGLPELRPNFHFKSIILFENTQRSQ